MQKTTPKRLSAAERLVSDVTDYRWRTPRGLAKRVGPAPTPEGHPQAHTYIALASQTFHAFAEGQVKEIVKRGR